MTSLRRLSCLLMKLSAECNRLPNGCMMVTCDCEVLMYKLIALDMDGTLLRNDGSISERTQQAIAAAKARGVKVVLASGRPIAGMEKFLRHSLAMSPRARRVSATISAGRG